MWSGPRTVSTAMMRAWENRPDTVVVDEPLYASGIRARCSPRTRGSAPPRRLTTSGYGSRRGCSRSSAARSSTRATCSRRPRRHWGRCAERSTCRSAPRCCPGRRDRATATVSGHRTGTTACGGPPGSPRPRSPGRRRPGRRLTPRSRDCLSGASLTTKKCEKIRSKSGYRTVPADCGSLPPCCRSLTNVTAT